MKIIFILGLLLVSFYCNSQVEFVSAAPYPVEVTQPDGSTIQIVGMGDESNHFSLTKDGFTVLKNKDGYFEFARKNKTGNLELSGFRANDPENRKEREIQFLQGISKKVVPSKPNVIQRTINAEEDVQRAFPSSGSRKVLLLLIEYPDLGNTYTNSAFNNLMNQNNYGGTGSFREYYLQASDGDLSLSVDVFGWYTAANNYTYYGDDNGYNVSRELVAEAVDAAEAAGVDFSDYDNDNNGIADNIMVVHSGPGAEEGSRTEYIWSHSTSLGFSYRRTYDGVTIDPYIIQPETRSFGMVGIGVFCHEFGHALGLPDLYDTNDSNGESEGLGKWCLMASGGWLNNESTPAMPSAWVREKLGWINPTVISSDGDYSLTPAATGTQCYKILTSKSNEYFLLENRYKTGFDAALPGSGLAVFHINTNKSNNADENDKLSDLEEADGQNHLDKTTNRGDSGDLFPGSSNNTTFNDFTNPDAKINDGTETGIDIKDIKQVGSSVTFTLGEVAEPFKDLTFNSASNALAINSSEIDVDLRVKNEGNENVGAFKVGFYLSADANVTTSDYFVGSKNLSSLSAGSSINVSFLKDVKTVFPEIPEGSYYVGYIIDNEDVIVESEENNNSYLFLNKKVDIVKKPNLTYLGANNSAVINGFNVSIDFKVENKGKKSSEPCKIGFYISTNNTIKTNDLIIGEIDLESLDPAETSSKSFSANVLELIPDLPRGFYNVGYYIDSRFTIQESVETDNSFTFTSNPIDNDLYSNLTYNSNKNLLDITASRINLDLELLNDGEIAAGDSKVAFYLSADNNITTSDILLGIQSIKNINVDGKNPVSISFDIESLEGIITEGFYYVGYLIDYQNKVSELFETDNDFTFSEKFHYCPPDVTQLSETICEGESFTYRDTTFKTEGVFEFISKNQAGCDSVIVLEIFVNPTNYTELSEVICRNESVTIGEISYENTGVYTQVFSNKYGCDSTVTLFLEVIEPVKTFLAESICEGEYVEVAGVKYNKTGVYENTILSASACDSIITLNLTVNPHSDTLLTKVICEGESISVGNSVYSTSGVFTDKLINRFGCDSIVTLDLIVNPVQEVEINEVICFGDSVQIGPFTYFETGTYTNTFPNRFECDSTVILHLKVNPLSDTLLNVVLCEGETYSVGNSTYFETGVYTELLKNRFNCDSLVTLDLIVNPVHETLIEKIICEGENVTIGSSVYAVSGNYTDVLTNQFGCDSTVYLSLTVNPTHEIDIYENICMGTTYLFGGTNFDSSGIYEHTFSNQFGCDSMVTLHLNVVPLPIIDLGDNFTMYSTETKILDAGSGFANYVWNTGETTPSITINNTKGLGANSYSVMVSDEYSCSSSDEIKITIYDDTDPENDKEPLLKIFPNPNRGNMNLLIEDLSGSYQLRVFSKSGTMVYQNEFTATENKFIQNLNISFLNPGIYTVQIITNDKVLVDRFVISQF